MTLTATNIFLNVTGVTITPPSPATAINLTEVDDVDTDRSGENINRYGDARKFPRVINTVKNKRTLKIVGASRKQLAAVPQGVPCTIVWNEPDAVNGVQAGGGGLAGQLINAVCHKNPFSLKNNQYGTGSLDFEAYSIDDTDPLTLTPL